MNILGQIAIVFGLCFAGEIVSGLLPVQFPASVIAMLLLFVLLLCKVIRKEHIDDLTSFLVNNMSFFFIPPTVAIIKSYDIFKDYVVQLVIISVVSTVLTFAATAYTVVLVTKLLEKRRSKHE